MSTAHRGDKVEVSPANYRSGLWRLPLVVGGLAAGTCTHGGAPHGGHGGGRLIRRQASMEHNHKRGPNTKGGRGRPSGVRPQSDIDT